MIQLRPTRIELAQRDLPMSRLGPPSLLPRFRWQQPIPDSGVVPNVGLSAEESRNGFYWGQDSILPYRVQGDYDRAQQRAEIPVVTVDNGRLRLTVAPGLGGRVLDLCDLRLDRDLIFRNPVFQPANLAALGAWFSGGIEWNGLTPGHSPTTCSPVFCGVVETERGSLLRLYEFDRIVEAAWQIDLYLPAGDDRLFVHGRIVNPDAMSKRAYWWTNVAVPMTPGTRVISPADYAIEHVLPDNHLERFPFPDPDRFDGSYPGNWQDAVSVFFRAPLARRRYLAALGSDGTGLAQAATAAMTGRKFFYFGTGQGGQNWMDFLARPGEGDYLEVQSGLTPTQNQRFDLGPRSELHWTEVYGSLSVDQALAHHADYGHAAVAVAEAVDQRFPSDGLAEIDNFLRNASRLPVTRRLSEGARWGTRHERLIGREIAPGLDFVTSGPRELWDNIADGVQVSRTSGSRVPEEIAVSPLWQGAIKRHANCHGESGLHALLLGIAKLDSDDGVAARELFDVAIAQEPSWLAFRMRALVTAEEDQAMEYWRAAMAFPDAPDDLVIEVVGQLQGKGRDDELDAVLSRLPDRLAQNDRIRLARAYLAAKLGNAVKLSALLEGSFATIREGETVTADLWHALQHLELDMALRRPAKPNERASYLATKVLPRHLDFRMCAPQSKEVDDGTC